MMKSRKHRFQPNNKLSPKRRENARLLQGRKNPSNHNISNERPAKYTRLNRESYDARIHTSSNGVMTFKDVDGSGTNV